MSYVTLSNRDITNGLELVTEFKQRHLPVPLSYAMAVTIRSFKVIVAPCSRSGWVLSRHMKC